MASVLQIVDCVVEWIATDALLIATVVFRSRDIKSQARNIRAGKVNAHSQTAMVVPLSNITARVILVSSEQQPLRFTTKANEELPGAAVPVMAGRIWIQ